MVLLVAIVWVMGTACSPGSDSAAAVPVISEEEIVASTSRYLDSLDGPPIPLWPDVGAPGLFPQSCSDFVGFRLEENTPLVQYEGDGTYLVSLTDTREQTSDLTYRWRFDPETGQVASLQEIC